MRFRRYRDFAIGCALIISGLHPQQWRTVCIDTHVPEAGPVGCIEVCAVWFHPHFGVGQLALATAPAHNVVMNDERENVGNEIHTEGPDRPVVHRSYSFSLRNLIAVVTLLGILSALAMPIIERYREAARRAVCQNNLKTLGLAVHNYESAFKKIPVGVQVVRGRNDSDQTKAANWSWSVFIDPYFEQAKSYDVLNPRSDNCFSDRITQSFLIVSGPTRDKEGDPVSITLADVLSDAHDVPSEFKCPSDYVALQQRTRRSGVQDSNGSPVTLSGSGNVFELGIMSYVGANSSTQCYALRASPNSANGETIAETPDGVFHAGQATILRDFRDGQSNIVMFSERISGSRTRGSDRRRFGKEIPAGAATAFGCRGIGNSSIDGSATSNVADAWGAPDVLFSAWGGINLDDPVNPWRKFQGVSSHHPGGVNIVRVDSSVEFFSNIDFSSDLTEYRDKERLNIWQKLISIDDARKKEIVIPDWK